MALSGSHTNNFSSGFGLKLTWSAVQNVANNQSTVTVKVYLAMTNSRVNLGSRSNGSITIDGVSQTRAYNAVRQYPDYVTKDVLLAEWSRTINHNSDGTKSIIASASYPILATLGGSYFGTVSVHATVALDTIPRASQPTLNYSTRALGSAITISTNRASTSFKHTLKYSFGTQSGTIGTAKGVETSQSWTLPASLASAIPNSRSGTGTITCETYNGNTLIGSKSVSFTATVPDNSTFRPTATISSIVEGASLPSGITAFVQNQSRAKVTSTGAGKYSATIKTYSVSVAGIGTYTGSVITSAFLKNSGSVRVTLTVTDSRGLKGSTYNDINVVAYSPPRITTFRASRSESNLANISVSYNASISSISNQNYKRFRIRSKASDGSWVVKTDSTQNYTFSGTETIASNADKSYTIELYVEDSFTSITQTAQVGTAFTLLDFNASGKGMAIGKVSESNSFEVAVPTLFQNNTKYQDSNLIEGGIRQPGIGRVNLSSPGWYRVAKFDSTGNQRMFSGGGVIEMEITRVYNSTNNEAHKVTLIASYQNVNFFNQKTTNIQFVRGIRWQYDETNCYLDIYYSGTTNNNVRFSVTSVNALDVTFTNYEPFTDVTNEATIYGSTDNLMGSESGSNAKGNWKKFDDGVMIQWGVNSYTHSVTQAWGTLFASTDTCTVDFPIPFIATPTFTSSPRTTSSNSAFFGNYGSPSVNATRATNVTAVFRPTSNASVPFVVHWTAIGRWK